MFLLLSMFFVFSRSCRINQKKSSCFGWHLDLHNQANVMGAEGALVMSLYVFSETSSEWPLQVSHKALKLFIGLYRQRQVKNLVVLRHCFCLHDCYCIFLSVAYVNNSGQYVCSFLLFHSSNRSWTNRPSLLTIALAIPLYIVKYFNISRHQKEPTFLLVRIVLDL